MFFRVFSEKSVLQSMKDALPYFSYNFALHIEVFIHVVPESPPRSTILSYLFPMKTAR